MFLKLLLAATLAVVIASPATAASGNPNLCSKENWTYVQSSSGAQFNTRLECVTSRGVYQPSIIPTPDVVTAGQQFTVTGTGFHPNTTATLSFAIAGQPPYYGVNGSTDAKGGFVMVTAFSGCGTDSPYVLGVTVTDSFGVHASNMMRLC